MGARQMMRKGDEDEMQPNWRERKDGFILDG
jgi:hypothetical protein